MQRKTNMVVLDLSENFMTVCSEKLDLLRTTLPFSLNIKILHKTIF